jgi:methanol--5-hydroxybenzimidazolylcobamide Co-methyltransferase
MNYIPKVFAALVRAASAARSLVAFEHGATGPSKDCAYEGIYLKALLGIPIALEGKSAACAHFSHIGNIASAYGDLWSNESVQNVKLLSGHAPEVCAEMLAYDCRLMNEAARRGEAGRLRDWLVASDAGLDPQAYVLRPDVVQSVAMALKSESTGYGRSRKAAQAAAEHLAAGIQRGEWEASKREQAWLDRLRSEMEALPDDEDAFIRQTLPLYRDRFLPVEYGLT